MAPTWSIIVADPILAHYRNEPFTQALTDLVNTYKPEILLLGATVLGRDLAGSVATTLLTGLTADCTELAIDDERSLAATRPTFGGSLLCTIHTLNYRPQMATVRPRVMPMPERQPGRTGRIVEHAAGPARGGHRHQGAALRPRSRFSKKRSSPMPTSSSPAAWACARRRTCSWCATLAAVLGGEWGGSRPLVQKGWMPADRQIGQTGKTIRPKLYIAAGISGAIQHRVGVEGADLIVAINTDPNAPIFDFAHVGIVADAIEILPALTEAFRQRLSVNRLAG